MKFWEAMKSLEEGKKVRSKDWSEEQYIYLTADNVIFDEHNRECYSNFIGTKISEWEIYDDRKPTTYVLDVKKIREEKNTTIISSEESLEDVEIIEWEITTLTDDTVENKN